MLSNSSIGPCTVFWKSSLESDDKLQFPDSIANRNNNPIWYICVSALLYQIIQYIYTIIDHARKPRAGTGSRNY